MLRQIQRNMIRTARRQGAEGAVNLSKRRQWYANSVAYGFIGLQQMFDQRVDTIGVEEVNTAISETLNEYNRMINALTGALVMRTTMVERRYHLPGDGTLQPLDEWGNPLPVQPSGSYDVAFPLQRGGTAWGTNRETRALMTVEEVNRLTMDAMRRDIDWMRRHILAAIFTNTTWTYVDERFGSKTIQPLALASDGVTYVRRGGSISTDTHYLAQANAIGNSDNPYGTIFDELTEHPSNTGEVVHYIPTNLKATTIALADFEPVRDPDIAYGADTNVLTTDAMANRGFGGAMLGFGDRVLGKANDGWIVEWKSLPDSYILSTMTGVNDVVAMREHPAPELQGFFPEFNDTDGNRKENRFIRIAGFGVMNRVGAVVTRIGNASYAIPTGFTAPLAV